MAEESSAQVVNCPACGAPLTFDQGALMVTCKYCGDVVELPHAKPAEPEKPAEEVQPVFPHQKYQFDEPAPESVGPDRDLARRQALSIGGMLVVVALVIFGAAARGGPRTFTPTAYRYSTATDNPAARQAAQTSASWYKYAQSQLTSDVKPTSTSLPVASPLPTASRVPSATPASFSVNLISISLLPPHPAVSIMTSKDSDNVYMGCSDGIIENFSSETGQLGSFVKLPLGSHAYVSFALGPVGTIYAAQGGQIDVFDKSGNRLQTIGDASHTYISLASGSDGSVYAMTSQDTLVRFDPNGKTPEELAGVFKKVTGKPESDAFLTVDRQGNVFVYGIVNQALLEFTSLTGKPTKIMLDKKDGVADPRSMAVDDFGRLFISDGRSGSVKVYTSDGSYFNFIPLGGGAVATDYQNNVVLYHNGSNNVFWVQKP